MPWVLLATQAVWDRPTVRRGLGLACAVGGTILGGHVQTAAHVLLASALYVGHLLLRERRAGASLVAWGLGVTLGIALAAIEILPLGAYLGRSPVWQDRDRERVAPWVIARPRVFEMACVALPSLYGSQRRGEPNLARVVGADNQNESAGSFAGLATLIWLAPLAWTARRANRQVGFLAGLTLVGFCAAYRLPPVDNLLRALPVLKVTDNRRLTLWVAFGLVLLGGIGLDALGSFRPLRSARWRAWGASWALGAIGCLGGALAIGAFAPTIRGRAVEHYAHAAATTPGADPAEYRLRAARQADTTLRFVPRYLTFVGAEGLVLAALLMGYRAGRLPAGAVQSALFGLTLLELGRFGFGLNPAIDRAQDRPLPPLVAELQRKVGRSGRIIGLGAEFPPNTLMRYGLADARNYDSVETARNLDWFRPIYDPTVPAQTSRREISWDRVDRSRDRLRVAGVRVVVGPTPPPPSFAAVERWGTTWAAWLDADPLISLDRGGQVVDQAGGDGRFAVDVRADRPARLQIRETFDPGWAATVDGQAAEVEADRETFLAVQVPAGRHHVRLIYDPIEVRVGGLVSMIAGLVVVFGLTGSLGFRSTRSVVPRLGRTQAFGLESDS